MTQPSPPTSTTAAPLRPSGTVALAVLLPLVLLVTLWPTHALLRLKPTVVDLLGRLHDHGLLSWLTWVRLEVIANVAMVVPLAAAFTLVVGSRRWVWAVAACAMLSVAVELVQHAMPGRVASVLDVVANTTGALLGAGLAALLERLVARRRGPRRSSARRSAPH